MLFAPGICNYCFTNFRSSDDSEDDPMGHSTWNPGLNEDTLDVDVSITDRWMFLCNNI